VALSLPGWIAPVDGGVRLVVRVQPRASRTEIVGPLGDTLKIRLCAPPVDGAANLELIAFLSKRLRLPRRAVRIEGGERGRKKIVAVDGVEPDQAVKQLLSAGP
jgi:uncharacterized protein (TIGR00251 family)